MQSRDFAFAALPGLSTELRHKLERGPARDARPGGTSRRHDAGRPDAAARHISRRGRPPEAPEMADSPALTTISGPHDFAEALKVPRETIHRLEPLRGTPRALAERAPTSSAPSTLPVLWSRHFADSRPIGRPCAGGATLAGSRLRSRLSRARGCHHSSRDAGLPHASRREQPEEMRVSRRGRARNQCPCGHPRHAH